MIAFPLGILLHKVKCVGTRPLQDVMPKRSGILCKYLLANFYFISIMCIHQILVFDIMLCRHFI